LNFVVPYYELIHLKNFVLFLSHFANFTSVLSHCCLGDRKSIRPVNTYTSKRLGILS